MTKLQALQVGRWEMMTLIILQLVFASCAASVLLYRAEGWAPEVINFGWLSYRAFNIYISLALIAFLIFGLLRRYSYALPLLGAFSLFHMIEGLLIGFWAKAVIHALTLLVLVWIFYRQGARAFWAASPVR